MRLRGRGISMLASACLVAPVLAAGQSSTSLIQQDFTITQNHSWEFNMLVGTPQQMVTVALDLGSADLIFKDGPSPCVDVPCNWQGTYPAVNFNESKSLRRNNSFTTSPLSSDGVVVSGNWASDNISFGNSGQSTSGRATFLIQYDSLKYYTSDNLYSGYEQMNNVLGLGPRGLQLTAHWMDSRGSPGPTYASLLNGGLNNVSASFSIWTDPVSSQRGILTLGGLDESLYVPGTLTSMPIAKPQGIYGSFAEPLYLGIEHSGLYVLYSSGGRQWQNQTLFTPPSVAILDSRQNFSLPTPLLEDIGELFLAEWASALGMYVVNCDLRGEIGVFLPTMLFKIAIEDLLIPLNMEDRNGSPLCGLNIGESDQIYLSNQLLSKYFLAVDYESNQIAFGNLSTGPDTGQPARVTAMGQSIFGASQWTGASVDSNVDPSLETVIEQYTNPPMEMTAPQFYPSQSTDLVLGTNPVPSILSPNNHSAFALPSSQTTNAASSGARYRILECAAVVALALSLL